MIDIEILKQKIVSLEEIAVEIEKNMNELFKNAKLSFDPPFLTITPFPSPFNELHRETRRKYQIWYSSALVLIEETIPEKIKEFSDLYDKPSHYGGEGVSNIIRFDKTFVDQSYVKKF